MEKVTVYFGTYSGGKSKGIYVGELDLKSGSLQNVTLAAETKNPSFLAIHPSGKFVYAVGEMDQFDGKKSGAVSAYARDVATGKLTLLNQQPSQGQGPCHIAVDAAGKFAFVANYSSGTAGAFPIGDDGKLGEASAAVKHTGKSVNPQRQQAPYAHSINLDPANRFAFVADLGIDKVMIYRFDAGKGTLTANDPPSVSVPPGGGPRHFAFHPNGKFAYVINEMGSTVTAFTFDATKGSLTEIQTISTLPADFQGNTSTAEVQVHPSGKFLYGSNRGHDSIAIFGIDGATGKLAPIGHESTQGKVPRNFGIDPTGTWLLAANQNSDSVVVFRIDSKTGTLKPTGQTVEVGKPVCVKFAP